MTDENRGVASALNCTASFRILFEIFSEIEVMIVAEPDAYTLEIFPMSQKSSALHLCPCAFTMLGWQARLPGRRAPLGIITARAPAIQMQGACFVTFNRVAQE